MTTNEILARREGWVHEQSGEWVLYDEMPYSDTSSSSGSTPVKWQREPPNYRTDANALARVVHGLTEEEKQEVLDRMAPHCAAFEGDYILATAFDMWTDPDLRAKLADIVAEVVGGEG